MNRPRLDPISCPAVHSTDTNFTFPTRCIHEPIIILVTYVDKYILVWNYTNYDVV